MNSPLPSIVCWRGKASSARWIFVAVTGLLVGGCASISGLSKRELLANVGPAPIRVSSGRVVAAAESEAAQHEGDFVVIGLGESMLPFYRPGTALVVHPTSYFVLRPGMSVVYRNGEGTPVAHVLVEESERGWIAAGLNNREPDDDIVTPRNLIGIVRAAYAADGDQEHGDRSYTLAMSGGKSSTTSLLH